jgi:hypothetical protein
MPGKEADRGWFDAQGILESDCLVGFLLGFTSFRRLFDENCIKTVKTCF